MPKKLQCVMRNECSGEVTNIDEKGFIYCAEHAAMRRRSNYRRIRKLRPHEVGRLQSGMVLKGY